jgi:hypothetical protein
MKFMFYTDARIKEIALAFIHKVIDRPASISGVEPTITTQHVLKFKRKLKMVLLQPTNPLRPLIERMF